MNFLIFLTNAVRDMHGQLDSEYPHPTESNADTANGAIRDGSEVRMGAGPRDFALPTIPWVAGRRSIRRVTNCCRSFADTYILGLELGEVPCA